MQVSSAAKAELKFIEKISEMVKITVEDFYTIGGNVTKVESSAGASSGAITSIDQLMAHIRVVESSNRYYVDNGLGYFGAYQIDYANYDNWTHWTEDFVANGGVNDFHVKKVSLQENISVSRKNLLWRCLL